MSIDKAVPFLGKTIYSDMISEHVSPETRATATRKYVEMILVLLE